MWMEGEGRGETFGRHMADVVEQQLELLPYSRKDKKLYLEILISELEKYSFKPRKVGEPVNDGCVWELDRREPTDIWDPVSYAVYLREDRHLGYQKETSKRIMDALLEDLDDLMDEL